MLECIQHKADLCVVGGGLAGTFAAVTAARLGLKVCLMQDRPVLGGNASGEIRMWIRGAAYAYPEYRESGLLEELTLLQCRYNPTMTYPVWDGLILGLVKAEQNIELLLNCSCLAAQTENGKIVRAEGWQTTTYTKHVVHARYFADCSGDCILAPLSGAKYVSGRESKAQFGERFALDTPDGKTMGMSCLLQARQTSRPVQYTPPPFAQRCDEQFARRMDKGGWHCGNFWWLELGGEGDTVGDTERLRDRLVPLAYGLWDYIKNSGRYDADNWALDFVGFVPGKRESNRYVCEYTLTQTDIEQGRRFDDEVAYGGWPLDDHEPGGFDHDGPANVSRILPAPYPIPYRSLYSVNIDNLFVAGRNIGCTHAALSSTRVMGTCALLGQAVGAAAYIAAQNGVSPREVAGHMAAYQQLLRELDCFLLHTPRRVSEAARRARWNVDADTQAFLLSGAERNVGDVRGGARLRPGQPLEMRFDRPRRAQAVRIVADSDLEKAYLGGAFDFNIRQYPMRNHLYEACQPMSMPPSLMRDGRVDYLAGGEWHTFTQITDNCKRLLLFPLGKTVEGIRIVPTRTYGQEARILSLDISTLTFGR